MTLIIFTVIGLGGTTNFLLIVLDRCFQKDKIFKALHEDYDLSEDLSVHSGVQDFYEDDEDERRKSLGVISQIEYFDQTVLHQYLRKTGWEIDDPILQNELKEPYEQAELSPEHRFSMFTK
jgi:hypothetical protein